MEDTENSNGAINAEGSDEGEDVMYSEDTDALEEYEELPGDSKGKILKEDYETLDDNETDQLEQFSADMAEFLTVDNSKQVIKKILFFEGCNLIC